MIGIYFNYTTNLDFINQSRYHIESDINLDLSAHAVKSDLKLNSEKF